MKKKIKVIFCMLLFVIGAIQLVEATDNGRENTSFEQNVKFYASDSTDEGITEFYNDGSSTFVILAHSIIADPDTFYIIPPGQWIDFDALGNNQGSIPFDSFNALLSASTTNQTWTVTGVKRVKYGSNPNAPWDTFGGFIQVGDKLVTCHYYWLEAYGSYLKCDSGSGGFNISLTAICSTRPHHIGNDPIFRNINHYLNFADCYYGVVETINESCIVECNTQVQIDYQTGFKGSYGEAFIPQIIDGPYPPHKPGMPNGPVSGKPGTSYIYSTYTIDPNGDEVSYMFDWGDGSTSDWFGPYSSGEMMNASHTWAKKGSYGVKVRAMDASGLVSEWSDSLPITMPHALPINPFLQFIFQRFPHAFPILCYLLGY